MAYDPCGVLFVARDGSTMRCYCRGHARFGGRCARHALRTSEEVTHRGERCGYAGDTFSKLPCQNRVSRPGERCGRHTHDALLQQRTNRRQELTQTLKRLCAQRGRIDARIERVRALLAGLGGPKAESEAAE